MGKTVCVIGLGYVGLPLANLCSLKGYETYGLDNNEEKIRLMKKGISLIKGIKINPALKITNNPSIINKCDIIIVCVPTPIYKNNLPNLSSIKSASSIISQNLRKDQLVIIESTINPGVTEEIILPILEKSGLKTGEDFHLAHCPERINPGDKKWNITNIPRVIGAISEDGLKRAVKFYKSILNSKIKEMSSIKSAEAVKIIENAFRDINIAFVNEVAKSFDLLDIDIIEVIEGASTKPFAFMPHHPSCGVGGHCIPIDPYYLIEKAKKVGFNHEFLKLARAINRSMPYYTIKLLEEKLKSMKKTIKNSNIGVLGLAYKGGIDDIRESPSLKIISNLKNLGAKVYYYDPHLRNKSNVRNLKELLEKSDYLILATNHKEFIDLEQKLFKNYNIKIIIDGKNCLDREKIKKLGIIYKGIGRS